MYRVLTNRVHLCEWTPSSHSWNGKLYLKLPFITHKCIIAHSLDWYRYLNFHIISYSNGNKINLQIWKPIKFLLEFLLSIFHEQLSIFAIASIILTIYFLAKQHALKVCPQTILIQDRLYYLSAIANYLFTVFWTSWFNA